VNGVWTCGRFALALDPPLVMGILNVTPDSFSDGGAYLDRDTALAAAYTMLAAGAAIVDVGGESTRPGAVAVDATEEIGRVAGVVRSLAEQGACVSVDTRHALVAEAALAEGASVLNDVSGFEDPDMLRVAVESEAGLVVMHMRGEPATMQVAPQYDDVVAEVASYLSARATQLVEAGVARGRIALDPGLGFGKTTAHNLELLRRLGEIEALGYPVLVGASRKRFIGEVTGVEGPRARIAGSVAAAMEAIEHGASIVRVHDVAETVQALQVRQAVREEPR
jgi:dihydropteroate synthase